MTDRTEETHSPQPETGDWSKTFAKTIGTLGVILDPDSLGAGALADLRRMDPMAPVLPPVFWRTLLEHVHDDLRTVRDDGGQRPSEPRERAWAIILAGMARMAPGPHARDVRAGAVLADPGATATYSEPRFIRLLRAEDDRLAHEVGIVCRWLAVQGRAADWVQFGRFVFERYLNPDGGMAVRLAQSLARDYFGAATKKSEDQPPTEDIAA